MEEPVFKHMFFRQQLLAYVIIFSLAQPDDQIMPRQKLTTPMSNQQINAQQMAQQYVELCQKTNSQANTQILQVFERTGGILLEKYYPPLSCEEEIQLQQRVYNYAYTYKTSLDLTQQYALIQQLNEIHELLPSVVNQIEQISSILKQLTDKKFGRINQLIQYLRTRQIPESVKKMIDNKYMNMTFHQLSSDDDVHVQSFITNQYVDKTNKYVQQLQRIFEIRAVIIAAVQIDESYIKKIDNPIKMITNNNFISEINSIIQDTSKIQQFLANIISSNNKIFITNKILSFSIIIKQNQQLQGWIKSNNDLQSLFAQEIEQFNKVSNCSNINDLSQICQTLLDVKQRILIMRQINQIAKLVQHEELLKGSQEIIDNRKVIIQILQKGTQVISQIHLENDPCLYYDPDSNCIIFELQNEIEYCQKFQHILVQELNMKLAQMPSVLQHVFGTLNGYQPSFTRFQYAASVFNQLNGLLQEDETFIIEQWIDKLTQSFRKACQQSNITLLCQSGVDKDGIERLQLASKELSATVQQFDEYIKRYRQTSRQIQQQISQLESSPFSVSALELAVGQIRALLVRSGISNDAAIKFYQKKVQAAVAGWYTSRDYSASGGAQSLLKIELDGQLEFKPSLQQIQERLEESNEEFYDYLVNPRYWISPDLDIQAYNDQLVDTLEGKIQLLDPEYVVKALQNVQSALQNKCNVAILASTCNDQLYLEKYDDHMKQFNLYDQQAQFMAYNMPPVEQLAEWFSKDLKQVSQDPLIYELIIHQGNEDTTKNSVQTVKIQLNMTQVCALIGKIPYSCVQVAVGAASAQSEKLAIETQELSQQFLSKMEKELTQATTNQQVSAIHSFFLSFKENSAQKLAQNYEILNTQFSILQSSFYKREQTIAQVQTAIQLYLQIQSRFTNFDTILKTKRQKIVQQFLDDLNQSNGIIVQAFNLQKNVPEMFGQLTQILNQQMQIVKKSEELKKMNSRSYKQYFRDESIELYYETVTKISEQQEKILQITQQFDEIRSEFTQLENDKENQRQLISPGDVQKIVTLSKTGRVIELLIKQLNRQEWQQIYKHYQEIFQSEWSIVKGRLDLFEEIQQFCETMKGDIQEKLPDLPEDSDKDLVSAYSGLKQQIYASIEFYQKLAANGLTIIRILKAPSLMKQHWLEIASKLNIKNIYNFFACKEEFKEMQLPSNISGQTILYAVYLYCYEDKSLSAAQNGLRQIVARADGEQNVRQALDEVIMWYQTEANATFSMLDISQVSQEEVNDIGKLSYIPLHANWQRILQQIAEKKVIFASLRANPFVKSLEVQVNEAEAAIEAITRLVQTLSSIQKKLGVLEPVVARKVLPEQFRTFYKAFRFLYFLLTSPLMNEDKVQDRQVQIPLMELIQQEIPDNLKLQERQQGTSQIEVDNSSLGVYKEVILGIETADLHFVEVQNALRVYLEQKRLFFPRFFFVSDADVLEILASGSTKPEEIIQPHIKKLFSSIESLKIEITSKGHEIVGFSSQEGEYIKTFQNVVITPDMAPELWLSRLEITMKETIRLEVFKYLDIQGPKTNFDINKLSIQECLSISQLFGMPHANNLDGDGDSFYTYEDLKAAYSKPADITSCSGEVIAIALQLMFVASVEFALQSQQQDAALGHIQSRIQKILATFTAKILEPEIASASFGTIEYVYARKLRMLTSDAAWNVRVLEQLISCGGNVSQRLWIWNRTMKYRLSKKSGFLCIQALDGTMPYGYEYQGLPIRLIQTQLTDRGVNTLMTALNTERSANLIGPAGTGKTETVKFHCQRLGRSVVVFNCDTAIDRESLGRILAGIVLSGSAGCFDEINRLSPSVLSAISTDIEALLRAIAKRRVQNSANNKSSNNDNTAFGGIDGQDVVSVPGVDIPLSRVSPMASVFVTMNPPGREYRGRSELPFSLTRLLRPAWMGRADVSQVLSASLAAGGFKFANIWGTKVDLTYVLASRRIQKDVHLDWGLRSLQAVIRQAEVLRAASFTELTKAQGNKASSDDQIETLERKSILKALSDATMTRLQGRSSSTFIQILTDVFGAAANTEQTVQTGQHVRFGAVGTSEEIIASFLDTSDEQTGRLCLSLYRSLISKVGVTLLGKAATGKTMVRHLLATAINKASENHIKIVEYVISPKSMSRDDFLGRVEPQAKQWIDGALPKASREALQCVANGKTSKSVLWPWIVLDGDLDPAWAEALNSCLDDNRLLSLASGERLRFPGPVDPVMQYLTKKNDQNDKEDVSGIPTPISFVFETDSLELASPATVSRMAVVLLPDLGLQQQLQFVKTASPEIAQAWYEIITKFKITDLQKAAEISTRLLMLQNKQKNGNPMQNGILALYSEIPSINEQQLQQCSSIQIQQGVQYLPSQFSADSGTQMQQYAQKLIQQYLKAQSNVIIAGSQNSGKYYCLQKVVQSLQHYHLCTLSCTYQSTRDDVIRMLLSECVEVQGSDGGRVIRPKVPGSVLVFCLRNVDVCNTDEYGHSQIYTLLWSILAHKKLCLKAGQFVIIDNIQVVVTVNSADVVVGRLRRLMGLVSMGNMTDSDIKTIFGQQYGQIYGSIKSIASYNQFIQKAIQDQETVKATQKLLKESSYISVPEFLKQIYQVNLSLIMKIKQQSQLNAEQIYALFQYHIAYSCPFIEGREAILGDLQKQCGEASQLHLTFIHGGALQRIRRVMELTATQEIQDFPLERQEKLTFTSADQKIKQLEQVLQITTLHIPGLKMFQQVLGILDPKSKLEIIKTISAIELSLHLTNGAIIVSQPNNFMLEMAILASIMQQHEIRYVGCDTFNSQTFKALCEKITQNRNICLVIDVHTIEQDIEWLQLICALASQDTHYIRGRLSSLDLRQLSGQYGENVLSKEGNTLSEEQITNIFLQRVLDSIHVVLYVTLEHLYTDRILHLNPPIRRRYGVISISQSIKPQDGKDNIPSLARYQLRILNDKLSDEQLKQFASYIQGFHECGYGNTRLTYNYQYVQMCLLQAYYNTVWSYSLKRREGQLKSGLQQLQIAQKQVDELSKQAKERQIVITKAQAENNEALKLITQKMEQVSVNKLKAKEMQAELSSKEVVINEQKIKVEAQLQQVAPLIEEAKKAVSSIPNDALSEVKSFNSPPKAVGIVLEAVVRFMGMQDTSWKGMKGFLAQNGVLKQIVAFDVKTVPQKTIDKVQAHVQAHEQEFQPFYIKGVSRAAAPLAGWVVANLKYLQIFAQVRPLQEQANQANEKLNQLRQMLAANEQQAQQLEKEAEQLKKSFDKKKADLIKYQEELEVISVKKDRGDQLLEALKNERTRWADTLSNIGGELARVPEQSAQTAAMLVLCGPSTDDVREAFVGSQARQQLRVRLCSSGQGVPDTLGSGSEQAQMSGPAAENMRAVEAALGSRGLLGCALSHAGDHTGVLVALKARYRNAHVVSTSGGNLANVLAVCARFGQLAIVTGCDSGSLPPEVVPYLRDGSSLYIAAEGADTGATADQIEGAAGGFGVQGEASAGEAQNTATGIPGAGTTGALLAPNCAVQVPSQSARLTEQHPNFKILLVSSVNLEIPAFLAGKLLQLSFASTEKSRVDFFADQVLRIWAPEALQELQDLSRQEIDLQVRQERLEQSLLDALEQSKQAAELLESQVLADALQQAKEQQKLMAEAKENIKKAENRLSNLKAQATKLASVVGQAQNAFDFIAKINKLYAADQSALLPILKYLLRAELKNIPQNDQKRSQITDSMVTNVVSKFLAVAYYRVGRSVFGEDRVGALTVFVHIMKPHLFTHKMVSFLTTGTADKNINIATPECIPDALKESFKQFLASLTDEMRKKCNFTDKKWEPLIQTILKVQGIEQINVSEVDGIPKEQFAFVKALFIISLRKDLAAQALQTACDDAFTGIRYNPEPLQNALQLADGLAQPIIIYTTAGQDPTESLNVENILALSPGREEEANTNLDKMIDGIGRKLDSGKVQSRDAIIIVKGAHLCIPWLHNLPSLLKELSSAYNNKYREDFSSKLRIILLLEPKPEFPVNLSRISWRICLQQEVNPQNSMLSLLSSIPPLNQAIPVPMQKLYLAIMYMWAVLHTIIEARRQYAPRGVASDPGWDQADFHTLGAVFAKILKEDPKMSIGNFMSRVTGLSLDGIYSVVTKDPEDIKLVSQLIKLCFTRQVLEKITESIKGGTELFDCTSVEENARNFENALQSIGKKFEGIIYAFPPLKVLQTDIQQIKQGMQQYISKTFMLKPTAKFLLLRPGSMLIKGQKESMIAQAIINRCLGNQQNSTADASSQKTDGISTHGLFATTLELNDIFVKEVKPLVKKVSAKNEDPLTQELLQQYEQLLQIVSAIEADFDDIQRSVKNPLLASERSKLIAQLINSGIAPESWCTGFLAPPTSIAPISSPDLVTLSPGKPSDYIKLLPDTLKALYQLISEPQIVPKLPLHLMPRPPAIVEALRRLCGNKNKIELDKVQLYASSTESEGVLAVLTGFCFQGVKIEGNALNFEENESKVSTVYITNKKPQSVSVKVQLYVDYQRGNKMPIIEEVLVAAGSSADQQGEVDLYGVYLHCERR